VQTFHGRSLRRKERWLPCLRGAPYWTWAAALVGWAALTALAVGQRPRSAACWLLLASALVGLAAAAVQVGRWHAADVRAKAAAAAAALNATAIPAAAQATDDPVASVIVFRTLGGRWIEWARCKKRFACV
jgi:hypothetical protein